MRSGPPDQDEGGDESRRVRVDVVVDVREVGRRGFGASIERPTIISRYMITIQGIWYPHGDETAARTWDVGDVFGLNKI
jgi:hypothetical protein